MKKLMKRAIAITMVITCMMGTSAFANEDDTQEIIEMETCSAEELIGGIPDYIEGPDREDLRVMLSNIDEYNAAGQYEQAEMIWQSVLEMLSIYQEQFGDCVEQYPQDEYPEEQNDDEWIFEQIRSYEESIMRYESAGYTQEAEELRQELDNFLKEIFGDEEGPDMQEDPDMPYDPDMDYDPDMNHEEPHGEPQDDFFQGLTPDDVKMIIEETESEIEQLEREGNFEEADRLRYELEGFLNEYFGEGQEGPHHEPHDEPEEMPEVELTEEEIRMVEETEAEIERLEREGNFEAADELRRDLDRFFSERFGDHHEEPHDRPWEFPFGQPQEEWHEEPHNEEFWGYDFLTVDEIFSRIGKELSYEQFAIISYLINEINEVVSK